jgi:hypothetical protein
VTNTDGNNVVRVFNPLVAAPDGASVLSDNIIVAGYASGTNFSSPFGIVIGSSSVGPDNTAGGDDDNGTDDDDDDGQGGDGDGGGDGGGDDSTVLTLFVTNLALLRDSTVVTAVVPLHEAPFQDLLPSSLVLVGILGGLFVGGALVFVMTSFARRWYKRADLVAFSPRSLLDGKVRPALARARGGFGKHHHSPLLVPLIPRVLMGKVEVLGSEQTPEFLKYEGHRVSWLIDATELQLDEMIGAGAHAQVFRGQWHGSNVAVKHVVTTIGLQRMREKQAGRVARLSVASADTSSSDGGNASQGANAQGTSASLAEKQQMEDHKETVLDTCFKEVNGVWSMVCGVWCMVHSVWCMVHGACFKEHASRSMLQRGASSC